MKSSSRTYKTCLILPETWLSIAMSWVARTYSLLSFPYSPSSRRTSRFSMRVSADGHCLFWWEFRVDTMWLLVPPLLISGNDSKVDGLVNFEKLRMIAKEIRHVGRMASVNMDPALMFRTRCVSCWLWHVSGKKVRVSLPAVRKSWIVNGRSYIRTRWDNDLQAAVCGAVSCLPPGHRRQ